MKKSILVLNIILNCVTIFLFLDLATFDSIENHLNNGGIVVSRPIYYAAFGTFALLISTAVSIYYLYFLSKKE